MNKPEQQAIDQEAALWVNRMSDPASADTDAESFDAWIAGDPRRRDSFNQMQAIWDSDAFVEALNDVAAQQPRRQPRGSLLCRLRSALRPAALGAAGFAASAGIAAWLLIGSIKVETFNAPPGPPRHIVLADGTQVDLSGGTLSVQITPWSRSTTLLSGQAYFDVAHERLRSFSVTSGDTAVHVLGTAFDVERQADDALAVQVYRGLVTVEARNGSQWALPAGAALRLAGGQKQRLAPPVGSQPGWLKGWSETNDAPLSRLVQRLNRFSPKPVRLAEPELARLRVTGRFHLFEPRRVLDALSQTHNLAWHEEDSAYILTKHR